MGTDPLSAMTLFVTQMIGLSVAAERVTETIKQWIGPLLSRWSSARYAAAIQTISIGSGIFVTSFSGLNPLNVPHFEAYGWTNPHNWMSWLIGGLLVCGGSAFWNHILDILQAAKVKKEQVVNEAAPGANGTVIAP